MLNIFLIDRFIYLLKHLNSNNWDESLSNNGMYTAAGYVKIKRPNTKTAIFLKCVNIFASNFARLFNTLLPTNLLFYVVLTRRTPK